MSFPTLKFDLQPLLPRLAWCASILLGDGQAVVRHGPWVETWDGGFCEGAWAGPFAKHEIDISTTLVGSGGRVNEEGFVFAAPTNTMQRLYSLRLPDRLLVSNSLVFLLAETGDSLDLNYPHYYYDFLRHKRRGLTRPTVTIPTAAGRRVALHHYINLLVRPDLSVVERPKNLSVAPVDYASYRALLADGVQAVFANAADSRRRHPYQPLVALSQGYDSPAAATLAVEAGCRDAFTVTSPPGNHEDGALVGAFLDLDTTTYDRYRFRALPGLPEAEFCAATAFGRYVTLAGVADQLEQTLLLTGHPGDDIWTTDASLSLPNLMAPTDVLVEGGSSLGEFRLRVGFQWFPVAWIGATHRQEISRITHSSEMKAWWVPGKYNRPIPRRISEEAGVPRELFGQVRMGTLFARRAFTATGRVDFDAYCRDHGLRPRRRTADRIASGVGRVDLGLLWIARRLPRPAYLALTPYFLLGLRDRQRSLWKSPLLYTFHWGVDRIRHRYELRSESSLLS